MADESRADQASADGIPSAVPSTQAQPQLLLLKPRDVGALYDCLGAVDAVLRARGLRYIVLAGSLLGAVRSASILFCDDDIDIGIFEDEYEEVRRVLREALRGVAAYVHRPWPGADRLRPAAAPHVWIDVFVLRRFASPDALRSLVAMKDNGAPQPEAYVDRILGTVSAAALPASAARWPLFHYDARKSVELWPAEFFAAAELLPLREYDFGPLRVWGPARPVRYLLRVYGTDCFDVFRVSASHAQWSPAIALRLGELAVAGVGGAAAHSGGAGPPGSPVFVDVALTDDQFSPVQHPRRRVASQHCRQALRAFLATEAAAEAREAEEAAAASSDSVRVHEAAGGAALGGAPAIAPPAPLAVVVTPRPAWFGAALAAFTGHSPAEFAFDAPLRAAIEPHIDKARRARAARLALRPAPPPLGRLFEEGTFEFDAGRFGLSGALAAALGIPAGVGPAAWHEALRDAPAKDTAMTRLLRAELRAPFTAAFDAFVAGAVAPHIASLAPCDALWVQAFPCVRVMRPGEFSLGPHCDAAYGFGPANVNVVVPLCAAEGANALYVEGAPGREDWHAVLGGEGQATRFHGCESGGRRWPGVAAACPVASPHLLLLLPAACCLHFTSENTTAATRVSLDLRVIVDALWDPAAAASAGDRFAGGRPGYYVRYERGAEAAAAAWVRSDAGAGPLPEPDERFGYPFTRR